MKVGQMLKERRIELDLTMKQIANSVGVSEATISRWESGNISNMKRNKIKLLADALFIEPSTIMEWDLEKEQKNSNDLVIILKSENKLKLLIFLNNLDSSNFKKAEDMIKLMFEDYSSDTQK